MTQQIQHRMSNPASPWVALGLLAVAGFIAYYYYTENEKKKMEAEEEQREAEVLPPSAWTADPQQAPLPNEVVAGELYKAVFTTPLTAAEGGAIPEYRFAYLPEGAFNVLDVLTQEIHDDNQTPVGAQVTITFIPQAIPETDGSASIIVESDVPPVFRGLSLTIGE